MAHPWIEEIEKYQRNIREMSRYCLESLRMAEAWQEAVNSANKLTGIYRQTSDNWARRYDAELNRRIGAEMERDRYRQQAENMRRMHRAFMKHDDLLMGTIRIIREQFDEEPPRRSVSEETTIDEWINFARHKGASVFENASDPSEWYIALTPLTEGDRKVL